MAYQIIRTNGTTLTTIQDGTINTTSTSIGLIGRNYAGYGQIQDTNFVRMLENFASSTPPANPLKGQLWYNTTNSTMNICPADGTTNAGDWVAVATATSGGSATLGNITVTGSVSIGANLTVSNNISTANIVAINATVSANTTMNLATATTANIATLNTRTISTGGATTSGSITGSWSVTGNSAGAAFTVAQGNLAFGSASYGIRCDNYMYGNGAPFNPSGTYTNTNVSDYLTGANSVSQFTGNIAPTKITTGYIAGGGTISGIWTLAAGAQLNATYADLAERFEADDIYDAGTVVEIGGDKEITAVSDDASEEVFGVVSTTAGFTMNGAAGGNDTHPAIAVSGRVPVKVIGKVKKGQRLVSAGIKGYARAAKRDEMTAFNVIGRALENKTDAATGTVLAVVSITK